MTHSSLFHDSMIISREVTGKTHYFGVASVCTILNGINFSEALLIATFIAAAVFKGRTRVLRHEKRVGVKGSSQ